MSWLTTLAAIAQALLKALGLWQAEKDRQAGAAISQSEATANEEKRVLDAANAGAAISLQPDPNDPLDRDRA